MNMANKRYDPHELISKIFLHLPLKSLTRLKTANKQLYSMTQDRKFIDDYRRRTANQPSDLIIWTSPYSRFNNNGPDGTIDLYDLGDENFNHVNQIKVDGCYYSMLPSSYGLVCLHGDTSVAVLNPNSKQIIPLNDLPEPFDPLLKITVIPGITESCYNELGFGFHPQSNTYKIVQLVRSSNGGISRCQVLTVRPSAEPMSWKPPIGQSSIDCEVRFFRNQVCANGALYWETISLAEVEGEEEAYMKIVTFDLGSERLDVILSPSQVSDVTFGKIPHLVVLQGNLCFSELVTDGWLLHMDISILTSSSGDSVTSWTRLYKLDLGAYSLSEYICTVFQGMDFPSGANLDFYPLCVRNGKVLIKGAGQMLYAYDLMKRELNICQGALDVTLSNRLCYSAIDETLVVFN